MKAVRQTAVAKLHLIRTITTLPTNGSQFILIWPESVSIWSSAKIKKKKKSAQLMSHEKHYHNCHLVLC